MTGVAAFLVLVCAVSGLACGHHAEDLPLRIWRAAWRAAGARKALSARLRPEVPADGPRLPGAPERRSEPRWALPPEETPGDRKPQKAA